MTNFKWMTVKKKIVKITAAAAAFLGLLTPGAKAQRLVAWPMSRPPAAVLQPPARVLPQAPGRTPERPLPAAAPLPVPVPPTEVVFPHTTVIPPTARVLPITHRGLEGTITDDIAHLTMEVRFFNDSGSVLEGDLYVPVPKDVVFDSLEMRVGDKVMRAELMNSAEARSTYENIVRAMRDPALLELVNDRLMRTRVYPIEPHSEVRLRFSYTQAVPKEGNLRTLRIPVVQFAGDSMARSQRVLDLHLTASKPIRLLSSPTHKIEVKRKGDREALVWYGGETAVMQQDLVLTYSLDDGPLAVSLSTHRERGEDGTYLLSMDPRANKAAVGTPKDIVFVLDRSASMNDDNKIEQLRKAILYCLGRLGSKDRFGIVDFGTGVQAYKEQLEQATPEAVAEAKRYVQNLEPSGGTNIEGGLRDGLALLHRTPGRLPIIVFLTDGRPTVGDTSTASLLSMFRREVAANGARFFGFGIGQDVNTALIDQLADAGRGTRDYVLPGEELEHKVARFYERIAKPALTDVVLKWEGGGVTETYPRKISDVYFGDPLVLAGRFHGTGPATLVITGRAGAKEVSYRIPVAFPDRADANAYLPRLWAHRKVAQLLDDVRLKGTADEKTTGEIMKLAKRYGIVTPYTSFLIADDKDIQLMRPQVQRDLTAMAAEATGGAGVAAGAALRAQSFSRDVQFMISGAADVASVESFSEPARKGSRGSEGDEVRAMGAKTFYLRDGVWTDSMYELNKAGYGVINVKAFGERYFALVQAHPELASWLAQGGDMLVVVDGTAYRITE